mgnify:CR=1 FL=1
MSGIVAQYLALDDKQLAALLKKKPDLSRGEWFEKQAERFYDRFDDKQRDKEKPIAWRVLYMDRFWLYLARMLGRIPKTHDPFWLPENGVIECRVDEFMPAHITASILGLEDLIPGEQRYWLRLVRAPQVPGIAALAAEQLRHFQSLDKAGWSELIQQYLQPPYDVPDDDYIASFQDEMADLVRLWQDAATHGQHLAVAIPLLDQTAEGLREEINNKKLYNRVIRAGYTDHDIAAMMVRGKYYGSSVKHVVANYHAANNIKRGESHYYYDYAFLLMEQLHRCLAEVPPEIELFMDIQHPGIHFTWQEPTASGSYPLNAVVFGAHCLDDYLTQSFSAEAVEEWQKWIERDYVLKVKDRPDETMQWRCNSPADAAAIVAALDQINMDELALRYHKYARRDIGGDDLPGHGTAQLELLYRMLHGPAIIKGDKPYGWYLNSLLFSNNGTVGWPLRDFYQQIADHKQYLMIPVSYYNLRRNPNYESSIEYQSLADIRANIGKVAVGGAICRLLDSKIKFKPRY